MANSKLANRIRRKKRVRKKIFGTSDRPRLTVFRSLKHIYAQIIDDEKGNTLAFISTLQPEFALKGTNKEVAKALGSRIAEKAKQIDVNRVVFDRNGYIYHGCIQALADAVREGGVEF